MRSRRILTIAVAVGLAVALPAAGARAATVGLPATPAPAAAPALDHVTAVGVHNTYQKATFPYLADALDAGTGLVELDVWADSLTRQWRVNHELVGQDNNCTAGGLRTVRRNQNLAGCLTDLKLWHDAHPGHRPVVVKVEFKVGFDSRHGLGPADFDRLVATTLGDAVYRPADLLGGYPTLDAAAQADHWSAATGRFVFEIIPGTVEQQNPFDHLWTDTEYAQHLRDLAAAGTLGSAQAFPAVLNAAAGDPRTRYPDPSIRPWFVVFDGSATSYVTGGLDPAWYDLHHYLLVMTDAWAVPPAVDQYRPTADQAARRVAQLADLHASIVSADWSQLPAVLGSTATRG